jgi:hydroxymethylpyrimidine pyrophosphatase-like HAD family hydrolase
MKLMEPRAAPAASCAPAVALPLTNLLNDIDTLGPLLLDRVAAGDLLNAFLLAAGMEQIAEDYLHRDPLFLDRAASRLARRSSDSWARIASTVARGAGGVLWQGTTRTPGHRAASAWLDRLRPLVRCLAAGLLEDPAGEDLPLAHELTAEARALVSQLTALPTAPRRDLVRLPSCFRSFDQTPDDVCELAAAFARRWPELDRPLLVAGIRSSGCYLAPLAGASLRRLGYGEVTVITLRPGQRWLGREAGELRRVAGAGGLGLVIDDPPRSWRSVTRAVAALGRFGFSEDRTVLMLATFADSAEPPRELCAHPAVLLPVAGWAMRRRLEPDSIRESLSRLLGGGAEVLSVRPTEDVRATTRRGHLHGVYEIGVRTGGNTGRCLVQARGVGLGYLGEHAMAVAARLGDRITQVYGLDRGLLFEAWSPPTSRLRTPLPEGSAAEVAAYVAARADALSLAGDPARRLRYRGAVWQWAGQAFGGLFGRASELGRLVGVTVARRLLTVARPAVIDNRTNLEAFAVRPAGGPVVKGDFDSGVFSSDDLYCFDPVFDVARAAIGADEATGRRLRHEYEATTGRPVDAERWLLYQLVLALAAQAKQTVAARHADRRLSRLLLRYYNEVLLADLEPGSDGPLCAIDVDGVLESMPLGFPATSPAGALALRTLCRHGYRPLLATGRSLDDVRDRCAAYGLAGGVAEYGALVYVHGTGEVLSLLEPADRDALERLRAALLEAADVHLDPAFQHSVRAFRLDERGGGRGLPEELIAEALEAGGQGCLRPVRGHYQTDFIATGTDKARGIRVIAGALGVHAETPLAMAVGDTASDLGMLRLAAMAVAPGNADSAVRRSRAVTLVRRHEQAGLAEAVALLVGHRPGGCNRCAPPRVSRSSRLLLDLLAVEDMGRWRRAGRAIRLLLESWDIGGDP